MAELGRICIPWDPGLLSPNKTMPLREQLRRQAHARDTAILMWRIDRIRSTAPIRLSYLVKRARALDTDNLVAALKRVQDGLCNAKRHRGEGIVPEDSPDWVTLGEVRQEIDAKHRRREVVIAIVESLDA